MTGKYSRKTNLNFLHADFLVLKMAEYLKLPATNMYEKMNIHRNQLTRQLSVELC
jgi:hypothetical protein